MRKTRLERNLEKNLQIEMCIYVDGKKVGCASSLDRFIPEVFEMQTKCMASAITRRLQKSGLVPAT